MLVSELIIKLQKVDPNLVVAVTVPSEKVATEMAEATKLSQSKLYTWNNIRAINSPMCLHIEAK